LYLIFVAEHCVSLRSALHYNVSSCFLPAIVIKISGKVTYTECPAVGCPLCFWAQFESKSYNKCVWKSVITKIQVF